MVDMEAATYVKHESNAFSAKKKFIFSYKQKALSLVSHHSL